MKYFLLTITFCYLSTTFAQGALDKRFWKDDKVFHVVSMASLSATTFALLEMNDKSAHMSEMEKRVIAFSASILLGFVKEGVDYLSQTSHASWRDVEANFIGALSFQMAVSIPIVISNKKRQRRFSFKNGF